MYIIQISPTDVRFYYVYKSKLELHKIYSKNQKMLSDFIPFGFVHLINARNMEHTKQNLES
jgi:hypothetical protein